MSCSCMCIQETGRGQSSLASPDQTGVVWAPETRDRGREIERKEVSHMKKFYKCKKYVRKELVGLVHNEPPTLVITTRLY